jgi:hypothetical protein
MTTAAAKNSKGDFDFRRKVEPLSAPEGACEYAVNFLQSEQGQPQQECVDDLAWGSHSDEHRCDQPWGERESGEKEERATHQSTLSAARVMSTASSSRPAP